MIGRSKVLTGVVWSGIDKLSYQGVQFVVQIILARLLSPEEFGIVAIAITLNLIFQTINEQGFSIALMYKKDRCQKDYSTMFWSNIGIAIVSYFSIFVLSDPISYFFESNQLKFVIRLIGLNLIIQAFCIIQNTILTISLDFRTQAKATLFSVILSGIIAVISAYSLKNVYAIVIQSLSYQFIYAITLFYSLRWKPTFEFSTSSFKYFFSYGYKLAVSRTISVLFDDLYTFGIGKIFTPIILGIFNRANSFRVILSTNIIHVIQRVSMPMLCKEQDSVNNMRNIVLKFIVLTAFIVYPLLAGLMILGKPLVLVLLTEKWIECADVLLFVCPIGFLFLLSTFNRNLYNSTGRTDLALRTEIIKKIIFVVIFFISIQFDFRIVLISQIIIAIVEVLIDTYIGGGLVGLNFFKEIYALRKILLATILMSCVLLIFVSFVSNVYIQLFVGTLIGFIVYIVLCELLGIISINSLLNGKIDAEKMF